MLARHLLFIATRRPHNNLLSIQSEAVPPHAIVQPPPYISPPKPEEKQNEKTKDILKDSLGSQRTPKQNEKDPCYERQQQAYLSGIYDPDRKLYENNQKPYDRNRVPSYNEYQRACDRRTVHMQNMKNQRYCVPGKDINQQFYTLPSRRPQREVEPARSVTPDITRGLGRGSLSSMYMLARHGQKPTVEHDPHSNRFASQIDLNRKNWENAEMRNRLLQNQQQRYVVDARNRFATPLSLSALGYRFFASSPVHDPVTKSPGTDALKHNPISPIGHGYGNGFKSSTPTERTMPTVAERLALTTNSNCPSPGATSSGRSTPVQTSSGRSTPTNLVLSPTKSTMSNEELFAAIHKSKKRLNIKDDGENMSPYGSMNSLVKAPCGTRHSWSPESQKTPDIPQHVHSPSATSRLDFKRLLLQQSVKTGPTRLSAAEQLKLSRQQAQQQQSSPLSQQTPLAKVLSPRSVWRFQTPRTDVLSSTIIEDTAAEEKAMKPSPENVSPISRLGARRQLDLCSDLPESKPSAEANRLPTITADIIDNQDTSKSPRIPDSTVIKNPSAENPSELSSQVKINQSEDSPRTTQSVTSSGNAGTVNSENSIPTSTLQYLPNATQLTPACQGAISAFESRRLSNQLARAQFLASTPTTTSQGHNAYFKRRFRARSESPQHAATQNVARSPSAPTLETAL